MVYRLNELSFSFSRSIPPFIDQIQWHIFKCNNKQFNRFIRLLLLYIHTIWFHCTKFANVLYQKEKEWIKKKIEHYGKLRIIGAFFFFKFFIELTVGSPVSNAILKCTAFVFFLFFIKKRKEIWNLLSYESSCAHFSANATETVEQFLDLSHIKCTKRIDYIFVSLQECTLYFESYTAFHSNSFYGFKQVICSYNLPLF